MTTSLLVSWMLCAAVPGDASTHQRVTVSIHRSIERSLVSVRPGEGAALAAQVARLIGWRGNVVRDVHPNDQLTVLFDTSDLEPQVVAMHYVGSTIRLTAHRFADEQGIYRYYDSQGDLIEPILINSPTNYHQITEVVQRERGKRRHHGIDLKAPEGTPIVLPYAARIRRVNWRSRNNGNCIEVRYQDGPAKGALARFLHLHTTVQTLVPGKLYPATTEIGTVGSTGRSSAPHLHYEIRTNKGGVLRPLTVHGTRPGHVSPSQQASFANTAEDQLLLMGVIISTN